jgi:DNA polymerase (family X)
VAWRAGAARGSLRGGPYHDPVTDAPEPPLPGNGELAAVFDEIGSLLEIRGELVFKTVAYHRAADAIGHWPEHVAAAYRAGRPPRIPGVGEAISAKIAELVATGRLGFREQLHREIPATLVELLAIPGVGPKTVRALWEGHGIETLDDLRTALRAGTLAAGPGLTAKGIAGIAAGLDVLDRRGTRLTLGRAEALAERVAAWLQEAPEVGEVVAAGSLRRRRETVGDLDLLATTAAPDALVERLARFPGAAEIVGAGSHRATIRLVDGPQVDLMIMPPGAAGTYLVHFTGSKEHNVRLRELARDRGWSLSEKGFARLGPDGAVLDGPGAELRTAADEPQVYAFLGLAPVPPELREDAGEIEAAATGRLPALLVEDDLRGDCHAHTAWSDGVHSVAQMAEAARGRGDAYLVLTDHTQGLAIARGLDPGRFAARRAEIEAANDRFAAEEAAGTAPGVTPAEGFRVLDGCELEIRADGSLDLPDGVLARFDLVIAAVHQGRRQSRAELTARVLRAIRHPHVHAIAHPAGRMLGERARDDLDLDWETIYAEAARTGTLLEIDGSDHRLDLAPERARRAAAVGCRFLVDSDAHRVEELADRRWGVAQARRAWLGPGDVANTWGRSRLLAWAAAKRQRLG